MADVAASSPDNDPNAMVGSAPTDPMATDQLATDPQAAEPQTATPLATDMLATDALATDPQSGGHQTSVSDLSEDPTGAIPDSPSTDSHDSGANPEPAVVVQSAPPEALPAWASPDTTAATAPAAVSSAAPSIASTLDVPASAGSGTDAATGSGGEWDLLVQKVMHWVSSGALERQWQAARTPLSVLAGLIAVVLVLRIYGALLGVIDSLPLLPGLLELAGVIAVTRFSLRRLVRSEERSQLINGLRQRWQAFRGQR